MAEKIEKKKYKVTDPKALFVAGQRIAADRTVELFDEAARYEVLAGNLEEIGTVRRAVPIVAKPAVES